MSSYLFYDLETTGLNKAFDQVLQFAAIRTDTVFNEIERHNIIIKLRPDVIPTPQATITHRISITDSMQGLCEFEAMIKIHSLMNQPGTTSIGYNNLTFDDEFLRFCFHRNLLPPYTHQYKNGCRRSDLLPMTIMYYLYKPEMLKWPKIDGKLTMKLEKINELNELASGQAHNAMVDVEATLELARKLRKETKMWDYLEGYFDKPEDTRRIEKIPISFHSIACSNKIGLMINKDFGVENKYQVPVLLIGNSIPYKNQTLWLRLDQTELQNINPKNIATKSYIIRKKCGEPGIVLPFIDHYNFLTAKRQAVVEKNQAWLQSHSTLFNKIIQYHREFKYSEVPDLDCDAALYQNGFLPTQDQELCRQFHKADIEGKINIVGQFEGIDMRKQASRLLCRNYSDNLPVMLTRDFAEYMQRVNPKNINNGLRDYKNDKRTTPKNALAQIDKLIAGANLDEQQIELLDELEKYLKDKYSLA
ncbi:exonuclease domain-containing protein [Candidatus Halobeggiatoa sp. HSG11]|nr:exonuclease domain-containing protein [Candidatus Halobeggiatoa sp. HSG11]